MPIDAKEALGYLGVDPETIESLDAFKETFDGTFQKREEAKAFQGRVLSSNRTALAKLAKELDLEDALDKETLNKTEKPWEVTRVLVDKLKERYEADLEAAKGAGGQADPEVLKRLEAAEKRRKDLESSIAALQGEYDGFKAEVSTKEQQRVVGGYWDEAMKGLKLDPTVDELRRDGFVARIKQTYRVQLDEEGKPAVFDANGERIKDPKKHGAYKDLTSLLNEEAEKLNLTTKNPNGNRPIQPVRPTPTPQVPQVPDRTRRPISPRALV